MKHEQTGCETRELKNNLVNLSCNVVQFNNNLSILQRFAMKTRESALNCCDKYRNMKMVKNSTKTISINKFKI